MKTLFVTPETKLEEVKEFLGNKGLVVSSPNDRFIYLHSQFGTQTLYSNVWIVKTDDDFFVMSQESYDHLCLDEIEDVNPESKNEREI